jgi:hypothetical protein
MHGSYKWDSQICCVMGLLAAAYYAETQLLKHSSYDFS